MQLSKFIFFLFFIVLLSSCSTEQAPNLTIETQDQIINKLTNNGSEKVWFFSSASLSNSNVSNLDISALFNIKDDEFIFSTDTQGALLLHHKIRYDINNEASNQNEVLSNNYKTSTDEQLQFSEENSSFIFDNVTNSYRFEFVDDNLLSGTLKLSNSSELNFELEAKTSSSYVNTPSILNFQTVSSFDANVNRGAVGFTSSYTNNSLYIAYRESVTPPGMSLEVIKKLDLSTNNFQTTSFAQNDFITKRLHIVNNELVCVGGQYANNYSLTNLSAPLSSNNFSTSTQNNPTILTRAGTYQLNNEIYVVGGDLTENYSDVIWKLTNNYAQLNQHSTLPSPKTWAEAEIVDDKVYIFGGKQQQSSSSSETLSYIYDTTNQTYSSFNLPIALTMTYATKHQHLVYVAGFIDVDTNNDNIPDMVENYIGAYNTLDDTFNFIPTNLNNPNGFYSIFGMTAYNNKLYIIYADSTSSAALKQYDILEANL